MEAIHTKITPLNMNVGTFARLTVLTAASFVEAFVNSVGAHEAEQDTARDLEIREQLNGTRNGRYLRTEYKLEKFPSFIRADRQSPLRVIDKAQRSGPCQRFFEDTKFVRDASMHYSPSKAAIICPPQDWLPRAKSAVDDCLAIAREFWLACYPSRGLPKYLFELERGKFEKRSSARL